MLGTVWVYLFLDNGDYHFLLQFSAWHTITFSKSRFRKFLIYFEKCVQPPKVEYPIYMI